MKDAILVVLAGLSAVLLFVLTIVLYVAVIGAFLGGIVAVAAMVFRWVVGT